MNNLLKVLHHVCYIKYALKYTFSFKSMSDSPLKNAPGPSCARMFLTTDIPLSGLSKGLFCTRVLITSSGAATVMLCCRKCSSKVQQKLCSVQQHGKQLEYTRSMALSIYCDELNAECIEKRFYVRCTDNTHYYHSCIDTSASVYDRSCTCICVKCADVYTNIYKSACTHTYLLIAPAIDAQKSMPQVASL
jgi:hypothetical protein